MGITDPFVIEAKCLPYRDSSFPIPRIIKMNWILAKAIIDCHMRQIYKHTMICISDSTDSVCIRGQHRCMWLIFLVRVRKTSNRREKHTTHTRLKSFGCMNQSLIFFRECCNAFNATFKRACHSVPKDNDGRPYKLKLFYKLLPPLTSWRTTGWQQTQPKA